MHAIAYNAIRALILQSAATHQQELGRISFKGAVDLLRRVRRRNDVGPGAQQILKNTAVPYGYSMP